MANPEHVGIAKRGKDAILAWRKDNPTGRLDLSAADLREADLFGADLSAADLALARLTKTELRRADLAHANLCGADLRIAQLADADLRAANLTEANLTGAYLPNADLRGADLTEVNLTGANASFADFSGTRLGWTILANTDLSAAKGLSKVSHRGPSTVGLDTLQRSGTALPETFLAGCGVTDDWLGHIRAILQMCSPVQFYSWFISYSHRDEEFCQHLHSRMRAEGMRVWFAPEDMRSGQKIHEQIDQAIRVADKLLLVLSGNSMGSEWVKTEVRHARQREVKEGKRVLFPIRLVSFETIRNWKAFDADTGKDMAVEVREYFIPDFSDWREDDAFEVAFKRLLDDLRADSPRRISAGQLGSLKIHFRASEEQAEEFKTALSSLGCDQVTDLLPKGAADHEVIARFEHGVPVNDAIFEVVERTGVKFISSHRIQ